MKRIVIHDLGPIMDADIFLKDVNVIIGEQSIGKSCVLKVACYCTWVERLNGYVHDNTSIKYETDFMRFSYDNKKGFSFEWQLDRWNYKRPKVSYIPAERNMVAVIPNWFEVKSVADNIQAFMADWSDARKLIDNDKEILNLNVAYHYEESIDADFVKMEDGKILPFTNVSSGLQSLIPLYVHLANITSKKFREREDNSVRHKSEQDKLLEFLIDYYNTNIGEAFVKNPNYVKSNHNKSLESEYLPNPKMTNWSFRKFLNITKINHCEVFLEEPEQNLFPPTQQLLMRKLMGLFENQKENMLFISTHSPYILDVLLEREEYDFGLFYVQSSENGSVVKTATDKDVQDMFEDGVDAFFNIERLGDEA